MATTQYDPVEWTQGPVALDALQQMANNDQFIFENMPSMFYSTAGLNRTSGIKIASGRSPFPVWVGDCWDGVVYFGNFFTVGCVPAVVVTTQSFSGNKKFASIRGLGNSQTIDSRGFIYQVVSKEDQPPVNQVKGGILNWIAMGY